jgi:hypothetical protein
MLIIGSAKIEESLANGEADTALNLTPSVCSEIVENVSAA